MRVSYRHQIRLLVPQESRLMVFHLDLPSHLQFLTIDYHHSCQRGIRQIVLGVDYIDTSTYKHRMLKHICPLQIHIGTFRPPKAYRKLLKAKNRSNHRP